MCNNYAIRYLSIAIANLLSKGVHRKILHESGIFSLLPHFDDRSVYILYTTYIFIKKKGNKKNHGPSPQRLGTEILLDLSLSEPQRLPASATSAIQLRCRRVSAGMGPPGLPLRPLETKHGLLEIPTYQHFYRWFLSQHVHVSEIVFALFVCFSEAYSTFCNKWES